MFPISSSEAVLLAFCFGEFARKKESLREKSPRFIDIVKDRIKPHVPSFDRWVRKQIEEHEMPLDLIWTDDEIGLSKTSAECLYTKEGGKCFAYSFERQRHSFFDLVISELAKSLELKVYERYMYGAQKIENSVDDPDAIKSFIDRLIQHNEKILYAGIGESFGKLIAEMDLFEDYVYDMTDPTRWDEGGFIKSDEPDDPPPGMDLSPFEEMLYKKGYRYREPDPESWVIKPRKSELRTIVDKLIRQPFIKRCDYTVNALKAIDDLDFEVNENEQPDPCYYAISRTTNQCRNARMSLWLAFGHLLGVLYDDDAEFKITDVDSPIPRSYRDISVESSDQVMAQIKRVESDLLNNKDFDSTDTLLRLAPIPEAIARKLWPALFLDSSANSVQGVFSEIIRQSGSEQEKRFASIARTLYGSYRNKLTHQFGEDTFTHEEVRFYIAAMRALVDLWHRIEAR